MSKIHKILFGFFVIVLSNALFCSTGYSQEAVPDSERSDSTNMIIKALEDDLPFGNIRIIRDHRIDSLLRKHIGYNDSIGIKGWKIMLYHGRDIKLAQDAGALFISSFPELDLPTVVDYEAPDFKTLVGAFRTKEEAYRLHKQILKDFEYSYLVHAAIKTSELK